MAFRDDREVLKQKARELERHLAEAEGKLEAQRGEAERAQKLEAELAAARATLERIEAQLPKPISDPARPGWKVGVALVGVLGIGAGAAMWLRHGAPAPAPPEAVMQRPAVVTPPTAVPPIDVVPPTPPTPVDPTVEVTAHWIGKAKTVSGAAIKPGAGCSVDAVLRSNSRHDVTISCGEEVLYRSTDALEGMAQMSSGAEEWPAEKAGTARAGLVWSDIGARTGARAQASINSEASVASAWRETAPGYRVEIEIPELSEPYDGAFGKGHSHDKLPFIGRVERRAKVTSVGGTAPVKVGAACTAVLSPQWDGPLNCRVRLSCGARVLYGVGNTGFSKCEVTDGKPTVFRDQSHEGDPMLTWDVVNGTIGLIVIEGGVEWNAQLSVDKPK